MINEILQWICIVLLIVNALSVGRAIEHQYNVLTKILDHVGIKYRVTRTP